MLMGKMCWTFLENTLRENANEYGKGGIWWSFKFGLFSKNPDEINSLFLNLFLDFFLNEKQVKFVIQHRWVIFLYKSLFKFLEKLRHI